MKLQPTGPQSYQKLVKAMGLLLDAAGILYFASLYLPHRYLRIATDSFVKDRSFGTGNWCLSMVIVLSTPLVSSHYIKYSLVQGELGLAASRDGRQLSHGS